uniref:Uncharacterized protein n=1 Tax=Florenciella parvula TaxID=236787 RepID=A0A7S2FC84_9STRA|mmetsp:Transcript_12791/g.26906  ORF Transcript_12791/g.26906 Transcript_12791/m.26906 type:complete len:583 (+) Transcript_12791:790-2538(+)
MREYDALIAKETSFQSTKAVPNVDLDADPDEVALATERLHGSLTDPKTAHIIGVTFQVQKRRNIKGKRCFPALTDDDRYRLVGRALEEADRFILKHPLGLLVRWYGATRERGHENGQLHGQLSYWVLSSGGADGAAEWVEKFWRCIARRVLLDASGELVADPFLHITVREPQAKDDGTFETPLEAALDHLMYTMKDVEAGKPHAQPAKGGHFHGGRRYPKSDQYKAAWAAFKARRTDLNSHGNIKRHFAYTAGVNGGRKNPIKVNTSNFIVMVIEWIQREGLWELYPSVLRMVAWMVEAGSHELQCAIIFGGRGHPLNEARANALNTVCIDPRRAADIGLIRLIFCGTDIAKHQAELDNVLYRPSYLVASDIVEDMTYADACQWRTTRRYPLRFIAWTVAAPAPTTARGRALVIDMGAIASGHSVMVMNELRTLGFNTTPVLNELGGKLDKQAFSSLGVLTLVADMIRIDRAASNGTPSFTGVTVPRTMAYTEQAFMEFATNASATAATPAAKIAAVSNALDLDNQITSVRAVGCGVQDWATFKATLLEVGPGVHMVVITEPERENHFAVVVCVSNSTASTL